MYSQEFIKEVKRCYPNSPEIIEAAERGDYFLGRYLDDNYSGAVPASYVLSHSPEEVRQKALLEEDRSRLYHLWLSGNCYAEHGEREYYCPANWIQNNYDTVPNHWELTKQICKGAKYVGYYPDCERYGCKYMCWAKYDALTGQF